VTGARDFDLAASGSGGAPHAGVVDDGLKIVSEGEHL